MFILLFNFFIDYFLIFLFFFQTKTVQVKSNETAVQIVDRCKSLFNLPSDTRRADNSYQLWLKISANEPLIPLIGWIFDYFVFI